jgi:hypothetical protein
VIDRDTTYSNGLRHLLIGHLAEKPQLENLLAEQWKFGFHKQHEPFQTVIVIDRHDLVLPDFRRIEFLHTFTHTLMPEHIATPVAHAGHEKALQLIIMGNDIPTKQPGKDFAYHVLAVVGIIEHRPCQTVHGRIMPTVYFFKLFFGHHPTFSSVIYYKDDSAFKKTKQNDYFFDLE